MTFKNSRLQQPILITYCSILLIWLHLNRCYRNLKPQVHTPIHQTPRNFNFLGSDDIHASDPNRSSHDFKNELFILYDLIVLSIYFMIDQAWFFQMLFLT